MPVRDISTHDAIKRLHCARTRLKRARESKLIEADWSKASGWYTGWHYSQEELDALAKKWKAAKDLTHVSLQESYRTWRHVRGFAGLPTPRRIAGFILVHRSEHSGRDPVRMWPARIDVAAKRLIAEAKP